MTDTICVIVDYGVGNLGAIKNILKHIGQHAIITSDPIEIDKADFLILPGVGAFDTVASKFYESGLKEIVTKKATIDQTPLLGICVGMQILFSGSEEGSLSGLGWVPGEVVRFKKSKFDNSELKIPHMAWTDVIPTDNGNLFEVFDNDCRFYFVHSFHASNVPNEFVLATAKYGYEFPVAVQNKNIIGVQFHPEKSHAFGMKLLTNFFSGE